MPRFAATALGWTGGWARHPHTTTWAKPQAGGQGRWMGAGASEGQARWLSGLRSAPPGEPPWQYWAARSCSPGQPWAALVPIRASLSVQPGSSPVTRSRGRRSGLCHPPLGSKSSLVPTVEQKAAHPWTGSPTPVSPRPCPLHLHLRLASWSAPPPQYLAQGASPRGLQGKVRPSSYQELLQAEPSTEQVSLPTQATPPTDLGVKTHGVWGQEALVGGKN